MATINLSPAIKAEIRDQVTSIVRSALRRYDKVATGESSKSVSTRVRENKDTFTVQVRANEQLLYVREGRKPQLNADGTEKVESRPPIDVLQDWLDARNLDINVYALQKSINVKGFLGVNPKFDQEIQEEVIRVVSEILSRQQTQQAVVDSLLADVQKSLKRISITR